MYYSDQHNCYCLLRVTNISLICKKLFNKKINVHKQFSMFVKQKNYNIEDALTNLLLYSSYCNEKKKNIVQVLTLVRPLKDRNLNVSLISFSGPVLFRNSSF